MAEPISINARQRAADKLIAKFERQIRDGELRAGEPLPTEREIVETHGVSRTVAREAITALANRGLVEARPRYRPVVREPSYDAAVQVVSSVAEQFLKSGQGVKNLFDLRIMHEASLVRTAALSATHDDLKALKEALAANQSAIEDTSLFYETDMAFHAVLYEIPGNPILPAMHRAYTSWLSDHWTRMGSRIERNRQNFAAHTQIFEAILLRDPDSAEEALREHLRDAWMQVADTFLAE